MIFRKSQTNKILNLLKTKKFGTEVSDKIEPLSVLKSSGVQFSKHRLLDFGELPKGEIPDSLKISPKTNITKLSNKITICSEEYPDEYSKVTIQIKAGSRYENIDNSGVSFFLQHLITKGPMTMSRDQFKDKLSEMGCTITSNPGREIISFSLTCLSKDVEKAVSILTEAILNPNFDNNQIEIEKELVYRKNLDVSKDQFEHLNETIFYTAFRDHMLGQSKYGIRDNIQNITSKHLQDFYQKNFVGENMIVVVTGKCNHEEISNSVEKNTQQIQPLVTSKIENEDKPFLTPSVMFQRDDEMANLNVGVGHLVPAYGEPEYIVMNFFEKIVGSYNANNNGFAHLNSPQKQYNYMQRYLGSMPGVTLQTIKYQGFSDFGILTSFVHGNDVWAKQMMYVNQHILSYYAHNLNQVEVFRARAKIFNELLSIRPSYELNEEIGKQILYTGRRIGRTEFASRISGLADEKILQRFAFKWFYDKEISISMWGPGHNIANKAYYDRRVQTSTKADPLNMAL